MELSGYMQHCQELVADVGWLIQGVSPSPEHRSFWYYTVGLTGMGHPEFTLSGLQPTKATRILNDMAARVREGARFRNGDRLDDVLAGYKVHLMDVSASGKFPLAVVKMLYPEHGQHALQIVFPDAEHRWPWEPGYSMNVQEIMFG